MNAPPARTPVRAPSLERSRLAQRLRRVLRGEVLFDAFSRGRYATDASAHHADPVGVVVPADEADVLAAVDLAAESGVPMLARGAGTSLGGEAIGEALVIDTSRALNRILSFDPRTRVVEVQPGITLERLDAFLRPHGLCFAVDLGGAPQATLGGLAGNDAWGSRSLAHGGMVHQVLGADVVLADGTPEFLGPFGARASRPMGSARTGALVSRLFEIGARERDEIDRAWPRSQRRPGACRLDVFHPIAGRPYTGDGSVNLAHLLVGSRGSLAHMLRLQLRVVPRPGHRVLGAIGFGTLRAALDAAAPLSSGAAADGPTALELLDPLAVASARGDPSARRVLAAAAPDAAGAVLLVEFAGDDPDELRRRLSRLAERASDLPARGHLVACTGQERRVLWRLREAGWRRPASPGARVEGLDDSPRAWAGCLGDWAVPAEHLGECAERIGPLLARHGLQGLWSGQAGVGALRVRVLDARVDRDRTEREERLREVAAESAAIVARLRGAWGGDSLADAVQTSRLREAFREVKALFDPAGLMNPGKAPGAPGRAANLSRRPEPAALGSPRTALGGSSGTGGSPRTALGGSSGTGGSPRTGLDGSLGASAPSCGGEGDCRRLDDGAMCPSFRVTRSERDSPRGRANTVRLALAGRLGRDALASPAMRATMDSCVGCKACRTECPSGVDVARMKIEVLHAAGRGTSPSLRDRLFADFPRYAPLLSRAGWLVGLRDAVPGARRLVERWLGVSARRSLPRLRALTYLRALDDAASAPGSPSARSTRLRAPDDAHLPDTDAVPGSGREVLLFADCFCNHQEPANLHAAQAVLEAAGWTVRAARPAPSDPTPGRPLCCGRTYLSAGRVDDARAEARRTVAALAPDVAGGVDIVGLEPACLSTMRDEFLSLGLGDAARRLADRALLFEEFVAREHGAGRFEVDLRPVRWRRALVQPHCHQRALGAVEPMLRTLGLVPGLRVEALGPDCCGMGGSFGYEAEHFDLSMRMAGLSLLPALESLDPGTVVVADGSGCRTQIADGARRDALHAARILQAALPGAGVL